MKRENLRYAKYDGELCVYLYATDDFSSSINFDIDDLQNATIVVFVDILEQKLDFVLQVMDWCLKNKKSIMLTPSLIPKSVLPKLKEHAIYRDGHLKLISPSLAATGEWIDDIQVGSLYLDYPFPVGFNEPTLNFASYKTLLSPAQEIADNVRTLKLSKLETIIWIDNWMQQNIQYIKDKESTGPDGNDDVYICDDITKQAIVPDVLLHHYGVCEDIAASVATIASLLEIDCAVMRGSGHAWNLVTLDGKTYILDCTHNITQNPNRMADALKATKYTSQFTLVGRDKEYADYTFLAEIGIQVSHLDFPRKSIKEAVSVLRRKGVLFEYGANATYRSRRRGN